MKKFKQLNSVVYSTLLFLFVSVFPLHAVAELLPGFSRDSFGSIVLKDQQNFDPNTELELSIGNYQNEPIVNYSDRSVFSTMGKSVGRLDVLTDVQTFPCTAFVVSKRYILTNYHCSAGLLENSATKATRIDAMQFVAGFLRVGVTDGVRKYTVIPTPVEINASLDYAIHEVIGDPSADFGVLELGASRPNDGDPFWIIGHPLGEAQRISREQCKASTPAIYENRLLHTCDTLPGNSGSPVIDASSQTVIALHHAGSKKDEVNFAILMSEILKSSKLLQASLGLDSNIVQSDAQSGEQLSQCDILYNAASKANQCFAYQAYTNSCSDHMRAPIAAEYIKTYCGTPEAVDRATAGNGNKSEKDTPANAKANEANEIPLKSDLSTEIVTQVQSEMNRLGCDLGKADGAVGPASKRALAKFNKEQGTSFNYDAFFNKSFLKTLQKINEKVCVTQQQAQGNSSSFDELKFKNTVWKGTIDGKAATITFTEKNYRAVCDTLGMTCGYGGWSGRWNHLGQGTFKVTKNDIVFRSILDYGGKFRIPIKGNKIDGYWVNIGKKMWDHTRQRVVMERVK